MGNIIAAPAPKIRADRAVDVGQERRQVYREVGRERSTIQLDLKKLLDQQIKGELRNRPVSRQDIENARMILTKMKNENQLRDFMVVWEAAEGRTFTLEEVAYLQSDSTSQSKRMIPSHRHHGIICQQHLPSHVECMATAFAPPIKLLDPWMRQDINASQPN